MKDLMTTRFECIAPYPSMVEQVGDIWEFTGSAPDDDPPMYKYRNQRTGVEHLSDVPLSIFPEVYKLLPWYAHGDIADMPEYIRIPAHKRTENVDWIGKSSELMGQGLETFYNVCHILDITPSTEFEYQNFLTSKNSL